MINTGHLRCKTYLCETIIKNKYKGYCFFCFINLFPNEKNVLNYKTKEKTVSDFIL